ncbi:DUF3300 domain-containing protein [Spirosoma rhododendri]|uniref:DUF3300 domain-containing protein n=1 Tax=Spirosoma rhododendri TaxID=2728024 RepID=A0A7L5DM82_9BACT|nr:DUF3300 domain-containing protein [Spirosoma rhododendri]QJD78642.1 DUF3300 domain-containing protein [Spirosoma rhododendri]
MNAFNNFPTTNAMLLGLGLLFAQPLSTLAQTMPGNQPAPVVADVNQKTLLSSVASYRDDVRQAVLLAAQQPQVLDRLARQQTQTQQAFTALIQPFSQTKQGWFYDMARFPDVLHTLAALPAGSDRATVQTVTKTLPADLQETAWKLYRHHNADLVQADNLNQQADQSFAALLAPLDAQTQAAFRQLMNLPDVLSLLTTQLDQTTQLGQSYQADPDGVTQQLATLHDKQEAQNQQELADYQRQLNQDPQAQQELQQAGQEYARANGYSTNGINPNPAWTSASAYNQNPYSYWFGYPYWYGSPLWYPSAFGYGTGFYYGLGGNMVVFGLPSIGFSNWFFNRGYGYYPHLYNRFNTYYTNTIGYHRYWSPSNSGFMYAAHRAFTPTVGIMGGRPNWLGTGGRTYSAPSSIGGRVSAPMGNVGGARTYSGGFGGRSFGGSSFGGMRSFGGGFHGGGRGGR